MAKLDRVALRYAKAVFDFLGDPKKVDGVTQELKVFSSALDANPELMGALTNEAFSTEKRALVVKDVAQQMGLSQDAIKVLNVLTENRRVRSTEAVAERLHNLNLEAAEIAPLFVEAPVELSAAEKKQVEEKFSKILGKKVEAHYVLEPTLLGGLRVTAAGRTYDGTLSGWLENMEEKLIGGRI
ncbi:MAG: ATP synthase F1 subunit delta [Proteobacteria bacterium]|nr:ATP synthase F1 subunit delta [Pseudomonadota bacterium]